jgi:hypothetical protein
MDELVVFIELGRVRFGGEPGKALLEDIHSERLVGCDYDVDTKVELMPVNEQGIRNVALNN